MKNTNNINNFKLGSALETHINLIQKLGNDGVEAELKRIREAQFKKMKDYIDKKLSK